MDDSPWRRQAAARGSNKRKRVRFEEENSCAHTAGAANLVDDDLAGTPRRVKCRVVELCPLSAELSEEEKRARWIRLDDKREMFRAASAAAQARRMHDNRMILMQRPHLSSSNMYANVYSTCYALEAKATTNNHDSSSDRQRKCCGVLSHEVLSALPAEMIEFMVTADTRGLEDRTAPGLALERRAARRQSIHAVLQSQRIFGRTEDANDAAAAEKICAVSETLTRPARTFAAVFGTTDATAAMLSYADGFFLGGDDEEQQQQQKQKQQVLQQKYDLLATSSPQRVTKSTPLLCDHHHESSIFCLLK